MEEKKYNLTFELADGTKQVLPIVIPKGDKGKPGDNGKSAYEVAVANGFKGTEEEWLVSLQGGGTEVIVDGKPVTSFNADTKLDKDDAFSGSYNDLTDTPIIPTIPHIPTQLSEMTEDATHRTVTDTEKVAWNGKAEVENVENALGESKGYTDTKVSGAVSDTKGYADTKVSSAVEDANGYTDIGLERILGEAKDYTDKQLAEFDFIKVVDSLPSTGLPNKMYLVPKSDTQTQDLFDEYVWVNGKWEWVTTKQIEVDLTPYVKKVDGKDLSTNDLTDSLKANYDTAYSHSQSDHGYVKTADLLNLIYPIGSIYMSVYSTSPAAFIGGSWTRLEDRFLIGASTKYTNGSKGGEATHTLTVNEMPSHEHPLTFDDANQSVLGLAPGTASGVYPNGGVSEGRAWTFGVRSAGGNQPHNNMPPYLAVYMWKRTA